MTKYIGNVPFVGKKKEIAFEFFCEECEKKVPHYWVNPYNMTLKRTFFFRLFALQVGGTLKSLIHTFHTWQLLLKTKKAVEIAACEECGQVRVKCLHCGNIEIFTNWQEVYICPKCRKKSYMFAEHPQPTPWFHFELD